MSAEDRNFLLTGTREPEPESRTLVAGPLTVTLQGGNLRTIRFRGHEVLRAVSFLVRDKDWGTCAAEITDLRIDSQTGTFSVGYTARYTAPSGAHLDCDLAIEASAAGELSFTADCIADADFETARAGFAVLHPLVGVAGQELSITHSDGSIENSRWPQHIDPWQPFMDIAAITHGVAEGIEAETRFSGDVFEMEDQRNWTDASYKTYVRPLALPWPYLVEAGVPLRQGVRVAIRASTEAAAAPPSDGPIRIQLAQTAITLPAIGLALRPECRTEEQAALDAAKASGATHLIAHFDPLVGHGLQALRGYADIARKTGLRVTLELAVPCLRPLDQELSEIAAMVHQAGLMLDTLFVSPAVDRQSTPPGSRWPDYPDLEDAYAAARTSFSGIRLGGGMLSYFTELNRKRVPGDRIDFISHCTNPIVHAADDLSVMQSFEALADIVRSTRAFYGAKPYRIGPSTIAMRQNPYGSATKDNAGLSRIPMANIDPRHNGQFGAAWTLAYAATVAQAGLEVLTLSTLAGPFGLLAGSGEPVEEGGLRPLGFVIAALGGLAGRPYVSVTTSRPAAVLGLASLNADGTTTVLLANITPENQEIQMDFQPRAVEVLGIASCLMGGFVPVAITDSIALGPFACARISV